MYRAPRFIFCIALTAVLWGPLAIAATGEIPEGKPPEGEPLTTDPSTGTAQGKPESATEGPTPPANTKPYALFGDYLERKAGIHAFGFLQVGYATNDASTHDEASAGHSNLPVVGANDEGLQLNAVTAALERPLESNLLPRVTPLPGPMPTAFSWGFRTELLYGRNGLPAGMKGFDSDWGINHTPNGVMPGSNRQNYLAMPQVFAQAYLPFGEGITLMVGRFGSGIGREIPPVWRPGPDAFYTNTYALVSQPDQVFGGLISANLMRNKYGLLLGEFGVVNGRQNFTDNNHEKSFIGALRWRSPNMGTWVDYSFMAGDEQNDLSLISQPQLPNSRIISPRGQLREHHSLTVAFTPVEKLRVNAEMLYGKQHGDGQPGTIDPLTFNPALGNFFTGGTYSGVNAQAIYSLRPNLRFGFRGEVFRDHQGVALFPATAVPGDFNALTAGVSYDLNANILFRPEIRYDWQTHNHGVAAFGGGRREEQTTFSMDMVIYF